MLDAETLLFVRDVLNKKSDGEVFSVPNLNIPGYNDEMADPQRRGLGKSIDALVRKHLLDGKNYQIEIAVPSGKPQLYRKVVVTKTEGLLLKEADICQTLRHLGVLMGWGNIIPAIA